MKQSLIKYISSLLLIGTAIFSTSCKKTEEDLTGTDSSDTSGIIGCMDENAYNYDPEATTTSNYCTFIKTTLFEITKHAEFNEDGNDWDLIFNTKADLILRIKEEGASDWLFEGDVINNQSPTSAAQWSVPTATVFKNINYEWELVDDETIGEEQMANGIFSPKNLAISNNEIVTTYTDVNGLKTELKIHYFIQ